MRMKITTIFEVMHIRDMSKEEFERAFAAQEPGKRILDRDSFRTCHRDSSFLSDGRLYQPPPDAIRV